MKKMRILVIFLFAALFISGCSCTKSMCSDADVKQIKASVREKWENNEEYKTKLREEAMAKDYSGEKIENYVNEKLEKKIKDEINSHPKACLTNIEMEDPQSGAKISGKSWGDAFKKGLLEGLIVYPVSWLLITFTSLFGSTGGAKILSIIITTLLIKSIMLIFTFKQQIQNQKLQSLQLEMGDITRKLNDPHVSESEKRRLQMKIMEIYKKNNINPLGMFVPTIVSMVVFLSVWAAVNQTLVIRTGSFLKIELGDTVSTQVFNANIGAIILFLVMGGLQILSMQLPNIIRKYKADYKTKNAVEQSNNQMKTTMNIMIVMILLTGFMLPAAIAVYWTIGALFSIVQTLVFQNSKVKEKLSALGNRKKKAKVVQ